MSRKQRFSVGYQMYGYRILHHGDCEGADAQAYEIGRDLGMYIVSHPPLNPIKRARTKSDEIRHPYDYRTRNIQIVNDCEVLFAAPFGKEESQPYSGTWMTVRIARRLRKPVLIIWPSGLIEVENGAKARS